MFYTLVFADSTHGVKDQSEMQSLSVLRTAICRAAAGQMGALSRIVLLCPLPQILLM